VVAAGEELRARATELDSVRPRSIPGRAGPAQAPRSAPLLHAIPAVIACNAASSPLGVSATRLEGRSEDELARTTPVPVASISRRPQVGF
jgi:hypothetical protein